MNDPRKILIDAKGRVPWVSANGPDAFWNKTIVAS
jgi:hypothetical protein